jgi:hypothetical protein
VTPEMPITSATRRLSQQQIDALRKLTPGQRIQVVQSVRVGAKKWQTTVVGVFRGINYLATGVTTDRVPEDDIVVPMVHFTKDNGELTSIAVDENSAVTVLS